MIDKDRAFRIGPFPCPHCGRDHDAASLTNRSDPGHQPVDGDYALCINCGDWGIYAGTPPTAIRMPRVDEWARIADNPECLRARRAWVAVMRKRQ